MIPRDEDQEIRRLMEELRHSEEASAPDFRRVLARARVSHAAPRSIAWRLAALAAALVVIAGVLLLVLRPAPEVDLQAARAIAEWKAPTDSLLRTSGSELLHATPRLALEIPDYSALDAAGLGPVTTPKGAS